MTGLEIAALILQNAPTVLQTAEEVFDWATKAWASVKAAYDQPAASITKEQLLAQLDRIKAKSDEIQAL
jgi:hypothetical protein